MKLLVPALLLVFALTVNSCKKSCNFPYYQDQKNICWPIGHQYYGQYTGINYYFPVSESNGAQDAIHDVSLGTKHTNSIDISQIAPDAEVDANGNFVVDTQPMQVNGYWFTIYGGGYFKDTLNNEMLVTNVFFQADSTGNSFNFHFVGFR